MKKYLIFGVLIFMIIGGTLPVLASGIAEQDPEEQENLFVILTPDHEQLLGGKSLHAVIGLERAEPRALLMEVRKSSNEPKDEPPGQVNKGKK